MKVHMARRVYRPIARVAPLSKVPEYRDGEVQTVQSDQAKAVTQEAFMRLSEPDRRALVSEGARSFEPMLGRPMREYVVVPAAVLESPSALRSWLTKAQAYAASLPPKKKR
jgi:hypothetical protein